MLAELKELGVHDVIRGSMAIIDERGLAKQVHCDPETGSVDIEGALMLACGAKSLGVLVAVVTDVVPPANMALFDATINYLNAASPAGNLANWNDQPEVTQLQVMEFLHSCACVVASAVVTSY